MRLKRYGELTRAAETAIQRDLGQCPFLVFHHFLGATDALPEQKRWGDSQVDCLKARLGR
jgi:hypothetical protein